VVLAELLHQLEAEALPTDVASWTGGAGAVRLTAPLVGVGIDEENQRVALVRERLPDRPPGMDEWGHASQISSSARSLLAPPRNPDAGRPDRH